MRMQHKVLAALLCAALFLLPGCGQKDGGDLLTAQTQYGGPILDFSANLNPLGMPESVRHAAAAAVDWISWGCA